MLFPTELHSYSLFPDPTPVTSCIYNSFLTLVLALNKQQLVQGSFRSFSDKSNEQTIGADFC